MNHIDAPDLGAHEVDRSTLEHAARQSVDDKLARARGLLSLLTADDNYRTLGINDAIGALEAIHGQITSALVGARDYRETFGDFPALPPG